MKLNNFQNQFVTHQLQVERNEGRAFQLTDTSVSPVRIVGYSAFGEPIEETICMLAKSANFVDQAGNICTVPLRTGRVLSEEPEAVRYEMIVTMDLYRAGCMPIAMCPHASIDMIKPGAPFITEALIEGEPVQNCGGRPGAERFEDACPHMQALITKRRKRQRELCDQREREMAKLTPHAASQMMNRMAQAFELTASIAAEANVDETAPRPRRGR